MVLHSEPLTKLKVVLHAVMHSFMFPFAATVVYLAPQVVHVKTAPEIEYERLEHVAEQTEPSTNFASEGHSVTHWDVWYCK